MKAYLHGSDFPEDAFHFWLLEASM